MRNILLFLVLLVVGCGPAATPTGPGDAARPEASLLSTVAYQGTCLRSGVPAQCDIYFYRDYDLGGLQYFGNRATWTMVAPVNYGKNVASFKFKARYTSPRSAWSQTIAFDYIPSSGATVLRFVAGGAYIPGAPTVADLPYTLLP